jgi:hypothetical protein
MFSVALSVEPALFRPSRPLAGTLPCGDRTFLPATGAAACPASYKSIIALRRGTGIPACALVNALSLRFNG